MVLNLLRLGHSWDPLSSNTQQTVKFKFKVAVYQEKLKELEERQSELITENMDLKELCLYLDQERLRSTGDRDEGDGSSNGTITGPEDGLASPTAVETSGSVTPTPATTSGNYPTTPSSTASYIKELESKIQHLEEEKKHLSKTSQKFNGVSTDDTTKVANLDGSLDIGGLSHRNNSAPSGLLGGKTAVASKPEAVVHAMKVLEVHEELEKSATEEDLDGPEKAIVREMCNVVWRKLGDVGDVGNLNESSDSILDPPFIAQSPGDLNQAGGAASPTGPTPAFSQGQAHSYNLAQPQPQMASTPLAFTPGRGTQNPQSSGNLHQGNIHNEANFMPMLPPGEKNPMPRPSQEAPYQSAQNQQQQHQHQHQRQQSLNYLHQHQHQQSSLSHGLSGPHSSNIPHTHTIAPGSKPFMQHQFPPTSFAPVQATNNQGMRPPPLSLPHHSNNSSATIQQRPLSSPTKSLSEHLPFSHPNFQHHQQPHLNQPGHRQSPDSMPAVSSSLRQGDQRPQFPQGQPPQQSTGPQDHPRSLSSSSSHAPHRPPYQNQQQQQQHYHHHHQQEKPTGSSHQPAIVRLLGAPGNRGRSAESTDRSRSGSQASGYQRTAPGGPPQPQQPAPYRNVGPNVRPGIDAGSFHNQPKPRSSDEAVPYEKRGLLSNRDPAPPNPLSSDPSPYGPLGYSHDALKTSGFRAYPPQPAVLPNQPAPGWGGPRPTNATDRASLNPGQPPPPNSHRGNPGAMKPNLSAPPVQNQGPQGKRFQQQEWRQTYLDDSDTL
ncbi:coiled-coil domain-containing protein 85C-like [Elysia marginata]|uniref:Coiled-coil domain-containing protein 85C-like n=1 Tax=Elysia marginata TaxID=1093978 RepID=A0AAV4JM68_9GAST|nr:coiled-coil domain-containing protein 85C-like [Elysia marginata]